MKSFPMFIRTTGRRVIIAGGSEQAAQKARLILKTDARIVIAARSPEPELADLIRTGRAEWHEGRIGDAVFRGAAMAFIATGSAVADSCLHAIAQDAGCPANVVDRPDLCDLTTPSLVDRSPLVVAVGTDGAAPVLARQVRTRIEEMLPANIGGLAAFAGRMRASVAAAIPHGDRRAFWRWVFTGSPVQGWIRGAERDAAAEIKTAIAAGAVPGAAQTGQISLVGAGPGARDLLTLRAVQRLQEADVIFYDRLSGEEVLELARRDARRVYVGKTVGANPWPQDRINRLIVAEAQKGQRVVRLKSGDPGIFGRAAEEMQAARSAGVPVELIPGVTSACAAAASAGLSLTERGATDTLVLTTAVRQGGGPLPDAIRHFTEGTSGAFYMAARQAGRIQAALLNRGVPADAPCVLVFEASKPTQQIWRGRLDGLDSAVDGMAVTGSAMILVSWPKNGERFETVVPLELVGTR